MAIRTDQEPSPKQPASPWAPAVWPATGRRPLPRRIVRTDRGFLDVLTARRSTPTVGDVTEDQLSMILWHAMALRERGPTARGVLWESRSAPSAGGLHPIWLMCLPIRRIEGFGIYDPQSHALINLEVDGSAAVKANARNVALLCGATTGVTLQFIVDWNRTAAAYQRPDTLIWRDVGALVAILCLTAEAFGVTATPLGRIGEDLIALAKLDLPQMRAAGAVHFTAAVD